jgi:soluble lytic murein transglycosylase-like protein
VTVNLRFQTCLLALIVGLSAGAFPSDLAILHNGFSIRHERREVRGNITRLYTGINNASYVDVANTDIERFEKDETLPAAPPPVVESMGATSTSTATASPLKVAPPVNLDQVVRDAGGKSLIDPDFINSVIHAESGFNTRAVSPKGAQGLMQLMPGTAANLGVANAFDPTANVDGGTRYLRSLLEKYNYDVPKALAAYNAGPHRVDQYHGVPPYLETRAYVARIIREYNKKKLVQQKASAAAARKSSARSKAASLQTTPPVHSTPSAGTASGSR